MRIPNFQWRRVAIALLIAPAIASAQEIKIGLRSEPTAMDPQYHVLTTNIQMSMHIFDGLTELDPQLQVKPSLAVSWEAVGEKVWEFQLRPDVKFSDGTPFTGDDVAFTVERAAKVPNSPGPFTLITRNIERVEVVGPHRVRFHTFEVRPLFPQDIAYLAIMSKKAASGPNPEGRSTAELNQGKGLIGTGPFKFVSWSRGSEAVLERNDGYWGTKPYWKRVVMRPITNPAARVSALLSGSVDLVEDPPPDDVAQLRKNPKLSIAEIASTRLIYLGLYQTTDALPGLSGTGGKNPFKDVRVRRALSEAIDRQALADRIMEGFGVPAADLMLSGVPGARTDAVVVKQNAARAKALLAEAGYPDGFSMTLGTPNGRYINDLKVAQAVASMWSRVGVKTTVEASAPALFFKSLASTGYSGFLSGWGDNDMPSRQRALISTPDAARGVGAANFSGYSNAEVDQLVEKAVATLDATQRNALLRQASAIAIERDVAMLPLYFERTSWGMRKGLSYAPRPNQFLLTQYVMPAQAD